MKNIVPTSLLLIASLGSLASNLVIHTKNRVASVAAHQKPLVKYRITHDAGLKSYLKHCNLFLEGKDNSTLSLSLLIDGLQIQLERFKILVGDEYFYERADMSPVITIIEKIEKINSDVDTTEIRKLINYLKS